MKKIGITQRVEVIESYQERRDCLDQRWSVFANQLNSHLIPLANIEAQLVDNYIRDLNLDAIILSGGNTIAKLDPDAKDNAIERDLFELELIKQAIELDIPMLGVCRGMQILNLYFSGTLSPIQGHVAVEHIIHSSHHFELPSQVNSYHNWCISPKDLSSDLNFIATDSDGNIEALIHNEKKVLGIMWHPEREQPFNPLDLQLFKEFLK